MDWGFELCLECDSQFGSFDTCKWPSYIPQREDWRGSWSAHFLHGCSIVYRVHKSHRRIQDWNLETAASSLEEENTTCRMWQCWVKYVSGSDKSSLKCMVDRISLLVKLISLLCAWNCEKMEVLVQDLLLWSFYRYGSTSFSQQLVGSEFQYCFFWLWRVFIHRGRLPWSTWCLKEQWKMHTFKGRFPLDMSASTFQQKRILARQSNTA